MRRRIRSKHLSMVEMYRTNGTLSKVLSKKLKQGLILLHCGHDTGFSMRSKDQQMEQKIALGVCHDPNKNEYTNYHMELSLT